MDEQTTPRKNGADRFTETNPGCGWIRFGDERFPDWDAVLPHLRERA